MTRANSFRDILKEKEKTDGKFTLSLAEFVRPFAANNKEVTITGKGTSMLPTITEQCQLVMAPLPKDGCKAGDILLYARANGQSVIHRIWRVTARGYDMLGDNQIAIERGVPKDAAVAYVKTIIRPDGRRLEGHQGVATVRVRYAGKLVRRLAGKVYRGIFRRNVKKAHAEKPWSRVEE